MISLRRAFRLAPRAQVALVGAGGKTTALFALARSMEPPIFVTTTTHLGTWQTGSAVHHCIITTVDDLTNCQPQTSGVTLFTGAAEPDARLRGLDGGQLDALRDLAAQTGAALLVEADGSRSRPLKAPAAHEPVIPPWVGTVIVVAGMAGLGQLLAEETVHRPERFAAISGLELGQTITADALALVLLDEQGGLKGIPPQARAVALLNGADTQNQQDDAFRIADAIQEQYASVVIASLHEGAIHAVVEPVAGVILAAGGASRFGAPKILLPWRGKPLLRHAAEAALAAGLSPVIAVLGAVVEPAVNALEGLPVQCITNREWQAGQAGSLRLAVHALPERTGAAVFLLADQPFTPSDLIHSLIAKRRRGLDPVVAPRVEGRRANPVLFGRETFAALRSVTGDQGGRAVFEQFPPVFVDWNDPRLLFDVDTSEDYQELQSWEDAP